jgi:hypothetical protein
MAATTTPTTPPDASVVRHHQRFPCRPESGFATRQFMLGVWPEVSDDVILATSELAANAIEHAGTDFEVYIEIGAASASVSVRDWAPRSWPRPPVGPGLRDRGRGLSLVGSLSHRWGWTVAGASKVVWFQV